MYLLDTSPFLGGFGGSFLGGDFGNYVSASINQAPSLYGVCPVNFTYWISILPDYLLAPTALPSRQRKESSCSRCFTAPNAWVKCFCQHDWWRREWEEE